MSTTSPSWALPSASPASGHLGGAFASRLAALLLCVGSLLMPHEVEARAVCRDVNDCGGIDERIMPPIPPPEPGPPAPRPALAWREVRGRLRTIAPRVDECFATHFEGSRSPRAYPVTVFVHPDGRWSLAFGGRARPPLVGVELRGTTPLEVCVADWVSSELGPRLQPPGGRAVRRVAHTYRPTPVSVAPVAVPADGVAPSRAP